MGDIFTDKIPNLAFRAAMTGLKVKSIPDTADEVVVTLCFALETDVEGQAHHYRTGVPMLEQPATFRFTGNTGLGFFERTVKGSELTALTSGATDEALVKVKTEVSTVATLEEMLDLFKDFLPTRTYKLDVCAWLDQRQTEMSFAVKAAPAGEQLQ